MSEGPAGPIEPAVAAGPGLPDLAPGPARPGQPAWSLPAALALATLAGCCYGVGSGNYLEIYYAAAVRSMASSWHDFFYAAFDPAGTVSIDKLPGALWIQALAVRLFGLHPLVLVLPQAIEGALAVLVLHRAVRRLAGPVAAVVAAALLAASPAVAALDRSNLPDSLMILLLALAADATAAAVTTGRASRTLLAGAWIGLAFQAKMLEAWLLLPVLLVVVLVASPGGARRRVLAAAGAGALAVVVSLSWMVAISLTPAAHRPYVDGSRHDSLFEQVFLYNGFGRADEETPDQLLSATTGLRIGSGHSPSPGPDRLLVGSLGLDTGWLLPAALLSLVAGLFARRRVPRSDPLRVAFLLFGGWLALFYAAFSAGAGINPYYTAALAPPAAALCATGLVTAWRAERRRLAGLLVALGTALTTAYAALLLPTGGTGEPGWLRPALIALGAAATVALLANCVRPVRGRVDLGALGCCLVAGLLGPAVATASLVADRLGAFDTPFQPPAVTTYVWQFFAATPIAAAKTLPELEKSRNGAPYLMATQSAAIAAVFVYASGLEVLPIGGFTGTEPDPTLAQMKRMIGAGRFHLVIERPHTTDPRLEWVARHCLSLGTKKGAGPAPGAPSFAIYYCLPSMARA